MGNDCSCSSGVVEPELGTLGTDLQLCGPIMSLHTIKMSKVTKSLFLSQNYAWKNLLNIKQFWHLKDYQETGINDVVKSGVKIMIQWHFPMI